MHSSVWASVWVLTGAAVCRTWRISWRRQTPNWTPWGRRSVRLLRSWEEKTCISSTEHSHQVSCHSSIHPSLHSSLSPFIPLSIHPSLHSSLPRKDHYYLNIDVNSWFDILFDWRWLKWPIESKAVMSHTFSVSIPLKTSNEKGLLFHFSKNIMGRQSLCICEESSNGSCG